jgi:hypothetical protein
LLKLTPQFDIVIDLTVKDDRETPVSTSHGLVTAWREIQNGKAAEAQGDWTLDKASCVLRPSMMQYDHHLA